MQVHLSLTRGASFPKFSHCTCHLRQRRKQDWKEMDTQVGLREKYLLQQSASVDDEIMSSFACPRHLGRYTAREVRPPAGAVRSTTRF